MGKEVGKKQLVELGASVLRALPQDISSDVAQGWIDNPSALEKVLRSALLPPEKEQAVKSPSGSKLSPCQIHCPELIPAWVKSVKEDVEPTANLDISKIQFKSFLKNGESWIYGNEMRARAVAMKGVLGLSDAKKFLAEQDKIPVAMRDKVIVFTGTVLLDSDGDRRVACLVFRAGRWVLNFHWLDNDFWYGRGVLPLSE